MRRLCLVVLGVACSEEDAGSDLRGACGAADARAWSTTAGCAAPGADGAPLTVRTVDEAGAPSAVDRLQWDERSNAGFWEEPFSTPARCVVGEPPCSEWVIEGDLPAEIAVSARRITDPATRPEDCFNMATAAALVFRPPELADVPLVITLEVPREPNVCVVDRQLIAGDFSWQGAKAGDCAVHPRCVEGPVTVDLVHAETGVPLTARRAEWSYASDSPRYDGEHELVCVDARCTRLAVVDPLIEGEFVYVRASYTGPDHPELGTAWSAYESANFVWDGRPRSVVLPMTIEMVALDVQE